MVKEASMVEAALEGHFTDCELRVAEQRDGAKQAYFHSEGGDGAAKLLMEQARKVAASTVEPVS